MFKLLFLTLLPIQRCDRTLTHSHRILSPKNRLFLPVKNKGKEEGFSILEVLVTILVLTGFILGSLQATVLATFMRVQAQDKQEATNWVQQDLELIRYQAFILDNPTEASGLTPSKADACTTATTKPQYGSRLLSFINTTYPASSSITINGKNYSVTRTYSVTDEDSVKAGVQTNILKINYSVAYASTHPRYKSGGDNVVTTLSTEVLPDAALKCP